MSTVKVVMVDNYDSFTYNLVQYFGELGAEVEVVSFRSHAFWYWQSNGRVA